MAVTVGSVVLDGRFRVLGPLGSGGMGEVFLAEQLSLGRQVALKVLKPELSAQQGMGERFRREARLLSAVDHPAVVRIIDFGESQGSVCLVMELVEGQLLAKALEAGPLVPDRAVALLTQLAEGLAAIHAKGIVHRDLHPRNVILSHTAGGEKARLLDFGIARLIAPDAPGSNVSQIGVVLGTPEYLSPEQISGAAATPQSDLYAFGVMAYEVLSGKLPFAGPSAVDYLRQHRGTAPRPLAEAAPQLAEQGRLLELVMGCLAKEPSQRLSSAALLAGKLSQLPAVGRRADSTVLPLVERPGDDASPGEAITAPHMPAGSWSTGATLDPSALGRDVATTVHVPSAERTSAASPALGPGRALSSSGVGAGLLERVPRKVVAVAAIGLLALAAVLALRASTESLLVAEARRRLDDNQWKAAIAGIDAALPKASGQEAKSLVALKAAALHRLGNHREEAPLLEQLDPSAEDWKDPRVLTGLVEDFARREESRYRQLLERFPKGGLREALEKLLETPPALRQWGALRYLDQTEALKPERRTALYLAALERPECNIRGLAAARLGTLADPSAEAGLKKLRATPKAGGGLSGRNCGQDEAAAALAALRKKGSAAAE